MMQNIEIVIAEHRCEKQYMQKLNIFIYEVYNLFKKLTDICNKAEGVIIAEYLPAQLSEAELKEMIAAAITESGATGPQQMGLVMKLIQPKIAGRADGGTVSSLVKAALSGGN